MGLALQQTHVRKPWLKGASVWLKGAAALDMVGLCLVVVLARLGETWPHALASVSFSGDAARGPSKAGVVWRL